ncbi:MAPEG family protein [Sarocladium implicatum]|nr:MAPEG family protein [Sarocladium implicatum]
MPATIQIPENYGLVLGAAVSTLFFNIAHVRSVVACRYKYGIAAPATVAGPEHLKKDPNAKQFDNAFRAHANYIENLPQFLVALFISGLKFPVASAAASGVWLVARYMYLQGYTNITATGLTSRKYGFQLSLLPQLGLYFAAAYSAFSFSF